MTLTVEVHAADVGGCGHYRMIWPGEAVAATGEHLVTVVLPGEPRAQLHLMMLNDDDGRPHVVGCQQAPDCDVLVIQRPLQRLLSEAIPFVQAEGVAVVVELDDDFMALAPGHKAFKPTQPRYSPESNWQWLKRACSAADLVTCTTPAIAAKYARHGRVKVIPNYLHESWMAPNRVAVNRETSDECWIGWSGSVPAHPNDLKQAAPIIRKVLSENPAAGMAVVGDGYLADVALGLDTVRASGWQEIENYPNAMAEIDVGVVPLDLTPFNEAKSWLKGLEFAALGVPFIASPTVEYGKLAEAGMGLLASNPREWYKHLTRLVTDEVCRMELGLIMKEHAQRFGLNDHAHLWSEAWVEARENATRRALIKAGV